MEIDRQTLMTQLTLVILMVAMVASTYLPSPWNMVAVFGTYAVLFGYMFLSQLIIQYRVAEYVALDAVIVGQPDKTHFVKTVFLVTGMETIPGDDVIHLTRITLAEPYKDPEGGRTKEIYLFHAGQLHQRLNLKPSKIYYKSMPINHPQVEHVMLVRDPRGYVSRAKLYPVFHLIATGGDADWYLVKHLEVLAHAKGG